MAYFNRPPRRSSAIRSSFPTLALVVAVMAVLAGCSSAERLNPFAAGKPLPPCPRLVLLDDLDRMTVFRDGPGRDLTDVEFEARIVRVGGQCSYSENAIEMETDVFFAARRGPADQSRTAEFSYFAAILDDERKVLQKSIFGVGVNFPPNLDEGSLVDSLRQRIPREAGQTGDDFTVVFGLQLTAEQLEYNRAEEGGAPPVPRVP